MAQPKYQLLQQWLRDQINSREYTANQQIPTELELAEQFGYSRQTIRQAISGLEQEGLLKRTPGRGTFVCQQNAGRVNRSESRTRRVGVLTTYLDDYIFPGIINGIERVLSRHDYLFTLGLTHNKTLDEATALQKLLAAGVDGLIHFQQRAVKDLSHPKPYGFIITNPPYGERLEEKEALPQLYREIGESYNRLDKWSMYLITSYDRAENDIGRKADKNRKIYNGMLKTYYYQFLGPKPPRRKKD